MHGVHQAAPNRWLVRSEQTKFGQDVLDLVQGLRSSDLLHGEGTSKYLLRILISFIFWFITSNNGIHVVLQSSSLVDSNNVYV